jgi:hypothetical protein
MLLVRNPRRRLNRNRNRIMTGVRFLFRITLRRHDLAAEVWHLKEPQKKQARAAGFKIDEADVIEDEGVSSWRPKKIADEQSLEHQDGIKRRAPIIRAIKARNPFPDERKIHRCFDLAKEMVLGKPGP